MTIFILTILGLMAFCCTIIAMACCGIAGSYTRRELPKLWESYGQTTGTQEEG